MASAEEVYERKQAELASTEKDEKGDKPEYGKGPPASWNPELVNAELESLIKSEASLYYLARQPIFQHKGEGKYEVVRWELLLRAYNGTQNAPAPAFYSHPIDLRIRFTEYQFNVALKQTEGADALPYSVNVYAKDIVRLKDLIKSKLANTKVIVELVEFEKEVDAPGFPSATATFDDELKSTMRELAEAGVKFSLDDVNHVAGDKHPLSFQFALEMLDYVYEIKLDLKMMVQIFELLPNIPNADKIFKMAETPEKLATAREELKAFVEKVFSKKPALQVVLELSIITEEVANRFEPLSPFNSAIMDKILVQGGKTDDWAERLP